MTIEYVVYLETVCWRFDVVKNFLCSFRVSMSSNFFKFFTECLLFGIFAAWYVSCTIFVRLLYHCCICDNLLIFHDSLSFLPFTLSVFLLISNLGFKVWSDETWCAYFKDWIYARSMISPSLIPRNVLAINFLLLWFVNCLQLRVINYLWSLIISVWWKNVMCQLTFWVHHYVRGCSYCDYLDIVNQTYSFVKVLKMVWRKVSSFNI